MPLAGMTPANPGISQSPSRWLVQVDTASSNTAPAWLSVFGTQSFAPKINPNMVDNSDFDTGVWTSQAITGVGWANTQTCEHKLYTGAPDPGLEFIRLKATPAGTRNIELVHTRWFDRYGQPEAFEGWALCTYENQGGTGKDTEKINVTYNGQGALLEIANPYATSIAPVLTSVVSPSGLGAGKVIRVKGSNLIGVTAVSVNSVALAANAFDVSDFTNLSLVLPTGSAGVVPITATNATGVSNSINYTRGT